MAAEFAAREFSERGWARLGWSPELAAWAAAVHPAARRAVADPAHARWLRCGDTWFAGVNVLDNDARGAVAGSAPLPEPVLGPLRALGLATDRFDRGQVSVVHPGYPQQGDGESAAAFRFRLRRDAAHVDGLLPVGPDRRRMLREPHGFILGLPLTETSPGASPLVLWERSHQIMRAGLGAALARHPPERWRDVDLTDAYAAARRRVFETCRRVALHLRPGEACLVHRLTLHGVAPWAEHAQAPPEGRMIVYFRPELSGPISDWIDLP